MFAAVYSKFVGPIATHEMIPLAACDVDAAHADMVRRGPPDGFDWMDCVGIVRCEYALAFHDISMEAAR